MKIGYARVSSEEQNLDLQRDALGAVGCDRLFEEKESGAKCDRTILRDCLSQLAPGDVLVVWKLDRLGRSLKHLLEVVEGLKRRDVGFISLTEGIDTSSPAGELVFHLFAALAQFERSLIRQRCTAGMKSAILRGTHCGRPPIPPFKIAAVEQLKTAGDSVAIACKKVGIDRATYYRHKKKQPTCATVATLDMAE